MDRESELQQVSTHLEGVADQHLHKAVHEWFLLLYSRSGDELLESLGLFGDGGGLFSGAVRFVGCFSGGERVTYGWLSDFVGFAQLVVILDLEMIWFLALG